MRPNLATRYMVVVLRGSVPAMRLTADIAEAMKLDQNITARMTAFGFAP